jgi:putative DNA primase/helicase
MCAIGDALDLEAYRRKKTRAQVLREDGFLDAPGTPPPSTPPPDDSDEPPFEDVRPEIQLSTNQYDVIKLAVQALTLCKNTYQRGNQLVRIVSSETPPAFVSFTQPAPLIKGIPAVSIGVSLTKHADIKTYNKKDKKLMGAHPPAWLTSGIEKRMEYEKIRPLSGIVEIPTLRPDGTMIVVPGYDPGTGLVYKPTTTFEKIPERASLAEAKAAMDFILDLVGDFPFAGPEYRSAWAAALFTPFARPAINGPAPLFMLDSNIRGSGKSKLCDLISLIVTGRTMARMANPPHDEEFKKLITSAALAGTRQIMIDNIIGPFGSAALDAALTSTTWQDRILGHSEMTAELPLAITWYVTGNNIQIVGDLCRRTIHVRIESPDEKPEERQNFKYQDVLDHALRNRARYVSAVLTVFGAYCAAGRPQQKMRRMDYVAWSDFVRGALLYVGLPDPALTQVGLAAADSVAEGLGMFITALVAVDPNGAGLSAQDILIRASAPDQDTLREAIGAICPTRDGSLPQAQQFGMKLHTIKRRVVDGYHLDVTGKTKTRNTKTLWCARKGAPRKEGNNE